MSQDKEHEDFKAWWKGDLVDWRGHQDVAALHAWEAWQARAALASQQAVKGEPSKRLGVEDVAHILSLAERYASTCKTAVHQRYGHRPMLTADGCKAHVVAARKALEEALLEFVDARPPDR